MGLNKEEVQKLLTYIEENNSWRNMYELHKKGRITPKYVTMRFDTRTGDMWAIIFSGCVGGKAKSSTEEIIFRTEQGYDLKTRIYEWLNGKR